MTNKERRKQRREANRASLGSVAAAPSFQAVKKKRGQRTLLRRRLIAATFLGVIVVALAGAPKIAKADLGTPEIDPGSMAGALTLLVGGALALTDRIRRV
jgi:hypothetical protein